MLKQVEEELSVSVCEKLKLLEDPLKKQKMEADKERNRYEAMEESVMVQLG